MKKFFAALCAAVLAVSAVSCGENGEKSNDPKTSDVNTSNVKTSIEAFEDMGQVIWDNDAVTVTFEAYEDAVPLEPVITLKILNKTDKERRLILNDFYVNDFSLIASAFLDNATVPPGETVEASINVYSGAMENVGIEEVGKVSLGFLTGNPSPASMKEAFLNSGVIDLLTDKTDWEKNQKLPEGELIYDEDGIRITAILSGDSFWYGYALPLFIENNSGENAALWMDSMRFDGAEGEMNIPDVGSVMNGKRKLKVMTTYSAYETASVKNTPEKTEVKFTITKYDGEGGESSKETDYIEIKGLSK